MSIARAAPTAMTAMITPIMPSITLGSVVAYCQR